MDLHDFDDVAENYDLYLDARKSIFKKVENVI